MNGKLVCQAVRAATGLPGDLQLVLIHLAAAADKRKAFSDGQDVLSDLSGVKIRTLKRVLKELEDGDYIRRDQRHRKDGRRRSDLITLTLDKVQQLHVVGDSPSASVALGPGAGPALGPGAAVAPPVRSNIKPCSVDTTDSSQEGVFEKTETNLSPLKLIAGGRAA